MRAIPMVAAVPQLLPVAREVMEQIKQAATRKIDGFKIPRP